MNESAPILPTAQNEVTLACERTKRAKIVGYAAAISATVAVIGLINAPIWPVAVGVVAVALMVTVVCSAILRR